MVLLSIKLNTKKSTEYATNIGKIFSKYHFNYIMVLLSIKLNTKKGTEYATNIGKIFSKYKRT